MSKFIQIAIDGPSGVGKSTLARSLAKELEYLYVDTGALYRAIGLYVYEKGTAPNDEDAICLHLKNIKIDLKWIDGNQHIYLCGQDVSEKIRQPEISMYASAVSALTCVREFLLETQRSFTNNYNVIMDGRDIGTVVLPNADVKLFISANKVLRAQRRYDELISKGKDVTFENVYKEMLERDKNDRERANAPCVPAEDAILFDNSGLKPEETLFEIIKLIKEKLNNAI